MQVIAKLTNESILAAWTGQQPVIGTQRIERTKESKPLDEFTYRSIDGDHTFGFELTERDMNRPLIGTGRAKAIVGQISTLADAHAGVADQQKGIATQIVAAQKLLLQDLILFCGERPRESLRCARNIFTANQASEFKTLVRPGQFIEDASESDQPADTSHGRQWRRLRSHAGHPAEDVGITVQL